MTDRWTARLSEYIDGEMPEAERLALEEHLAECEECAGMVVDLRRVVRRARTLHPRHPSSDLWPGIAALIGSTAVTTPSDIMPIEAVRRRRRISFSIPQLAAAAIALVTLSGAGAAYLASTFDMNPSVVLTPTPDAPLASGPGGVAAQPAAVNAAEYARYDDAVRDLEAVLAAGRGRLDSSTVAVLERNLAVIDRAIAEAQQAVAVDPRNVYVQTHLAQTMRRKLELLRQVAALTAAS